MTDKERIEELGKEKIIRKNLLSLSHEDLAELTLQYMCECKLYRTEQNSKAVEALEKVKETIDLNKSNFYRNVHIISAEFILKKIDQIIKEYGGKNE